MNHYHLNFKSKYNGKAENNLITFILQSNAIEMCFISHAEDVTPSSWQTNQYLSSLVLLSLIC